MLSRNYFFCVIVDIKDWGCQSLAIIMLESVENTDISNVEVLNQLIVPGEVFKFSIELLEEKLGLSNSLCVFIDYVIIIYDSIAISVGFSFVAVAEQTELMRSYFPHVRQTNLEVGNIIFLANSVSHSD